MIPLFVAHCFYNGKLLDLFTKSHTVMNDLSQLYFLNNFVSTYDFPSKYDDYESLNELAQKCLTNSDFISKKRNSEMNTSSSSTPPTNSVNTLPNSVDKIIDALVSLVNNDVSFELNTNELDEYDVQLKEIEKIL